MIGFGVEFVKKRIVVDAARNWAASGHELMFQQFDVIEVNVGSREYNFEYRYSLRDWL